MRTSRRSSVLLAAAERNGVTAWADSKRGNGSNEQRSKIRVSIFALKINCTEKFIYKITFLRLLVFDCVSVCVLRLYCIKDTKQIFENYFYVVQKDNKLKQQQISFGIRREQDQSTHIIRPTWVTQLCSQVHCRTDRQQSDTRTNQLTNVKAKF